MTKIQDRISVDGKTYIPVDAVDWCEGCAFLNKQAKEPCVSLACDSSRLDGREVIWVNEENSTTAGKPNQKEWGSW